MLKRIIHALSSLRSGSRKPESAAGRALAVGESVYFDLRKRDVDGNDFVSGAVGPFPLSMPDHELGERLLESLRDSIYREGSVSPEQRRAYWRSYLQQLGFKSERAFAAGSECVMLSGTAGHELLQQPCFREGSMFVGAAPHHVVRCGWEAVQAGGVLKKLIERIRRGEIDDAVEATTVRAEAPVFRVGQRVWHIVRQETCRVIEVDSDDQHGLGKITVVFDDDSSLSSTLLAPGIEPIVERGGRPGGGGPR